MTRRDPAEVDCPADVVDRLLWRTALRIKQRHRPATGGDCRWCGGRSPCPPQRLAERAEVAARLPMPEAVEVRNEITRLLPVLHPGPPAEPQAPTETVDLRSWRGRNRGAF